MCNGSLDLGSKTAFGSGKIGIVVGRSIFLDIKRY
tara:strand:- start:3574 stop:3678 length:105 start_codon:yes stop_codon:yes gene_type:complete